MNINYPWTFISILCYQSFTNKFRSLSFDGPICVKGSLCESAGVSESELESPLTHFMVNIYVVHYYQSKEH